MGELISAYIMPHPPIVVPEVGSGKEQEAKRTLDACRRAGREIAEDKPDTIILISPHAPLFQDYIYMSDSPKLSGNLGKFGAAEIAFEYENDLALLNSVSLKARQHNIYAGGLDKQTMKKYDVRSVLDHGAIVPLYFVNSEHTDCKLLHIALSELPFHELYRFGMCIREAITEAHGRYVILASGDLSHKLSNDSPYGYNKRGPEFDRALIKAVETNDPLQLVEMERELYEGAAECGLRSFIIMYGALDGYESEPEVYSYEGPFGVGYGVAKIKAGKFDANKSLYPKIKADSSRKMQSIREKEDEYVSLGRKTLEEYVLGKGIIKTPENLPTEMYEKKAGVFVSIKKNGQLRGCIGTTSPTKNNIAEEIIHNAISAGTMDPRFAPVEREELDSLVYSVDVLSEAEPIEGMSQLDPVRYGVIVQAGYRKGLLLPNLEGIDTVEEQVEIALRKAGIGKNEKYSMERFEVVRHV